MSEIFLKIINMSISASYIVLAVLLLRLILKKAPKWIAVVLWGIVAVRLICPFSIESVLSLIPSSEVISPNIMTDKTPTINTGIPIINSALNPVISDSFTPGPGDSANPLQIWITVLTTIWIVGMVALLIYIFISYAKVKRKIGTAVFYKDNIYQSENVVSPFVLGIIKPKIYLPFGMSDKDMAHVVAHEMAHIRRKDHLLKPLGFLLLALHWFNPLMWLGYVLLCRDIELACDEKVIRELDRDARADYSEALLTCSVNRRMIAACPLAFGEVAVKDRVKSVLNYKKPAFWIIMVAFVACALVAVCFLTNPLNEKYKAPLSCTRYNGEKDGLDTVTEIDFTEDAAKSVISILNEAKWEEIAVNCAYNFEFVVKNARIRYHSTSGVLVDQTNGRYSKLSQLAQASLNIIIGARSNEVMLIYDSPMYSFVMSPSAVPEIMLIDGEIYVIQDGTSKRLGTVSQINLQSSNFDDYIKKYEGYDHSELARDIRKNNITAYKVNPDTSVNGIELYYILKQISGETLIVYGHYQNGKVTNEIRFIYSIPSDVMYKKQTPYYDDESILVIEDAASLDEQKASIIERYAKGDIIVVLNAQIACAVQEILSGNVTTSFAQDMQAVLFYQAKGVPGSYEICGNTSMLESEINAAVEIIRIYQIIE